MNTLVIKNAKTLVILYMIHITNGFILEICRQKLNKKLSNMVNIAVKNTNIKTAFPPFKVGDLFSVKNSLPKYPKYFIVYRFTCPGCNASDIGKTTHHLSKRIKEHLETDSNSHIFKHLNTNRNCKGLCDAKCF